MRKIFFLSLMILSLMLAACGAAVPAGPTATPTPAPVCEVTGLLPPVDSNLPPVTAADWSMGAEKPTMTIIEYTDYQCPYCADLAVVLEQLVQIYPDTVRVVHRHFPLNGHPLSLPTTQAAEAAGLQGKFWEMNALLFAKQTEFSAMDEAGFETWLYDQVSSLELNLEQFKQDFKSPAITQKAMDAQAAAVALGLQGTPAMYFNGRQIGGFNRDLATMTQVVDLLPRMEAFEREYSFNSCPPMTIDPGKQYTATVKTEKGDFVIKLYADKAPMTVNNFIFLARQGWFNGLIFHRVIPGFVAQTGDPSGEGWGGPGYIFSNEIDPALKYDRPGLVGMANRGPDTNGSQWFVTYAPQPDLDGGYTIFGEVISGMDVVESLTPRNPSGQEDLPPGDKIVSVEITEQ